MNRTSDASTDSHEHRAASSTARTTRDHDCHDRSRVILGRQIRPRALLSALCAGVLSLPLFIAADGLSQSEHSVTSPAAAVPEPTELEGTLSFATFVVEEGREVIATGDLKIVCAGSATVAGVITAYPNVKIEIIAGQTIEITGHIRAGDGASGLATERGGSNGGDVRLEADSIFIRGGHVRAGRGGDGGLGGRGGRGGTVFMVADLLVGDGSSQVAAGGGGRGGDGLSPRSAVGRFIEAGEGGDAGSLVIDVAQAVAEPEVPAGGAGPVAQCCANGTDGRAGSGHPRYSGAVGGDGGNGADGFPHLLLCNGKPGEDGGRGGHGFAFGGLRGEAGGDCCSGTGCDGGSGGSGGDGVGGAGGKGGNGGNGAAFRRNVTYADCSWVRGSGGDGGAGGAGGNAWGGSGGEGGRGGNGLTPGEGGSGGAAGQVIPGAGGAGGLGGRPGRASPDPNCQNIGGTPGVAGPTGAAGQAANSPVSGMRGPDGGFCTP